MCPDLIKQECLTVHNIVRKYHSANPLVWEKPQPGLEKSPTEVASELNQGMGLFGTTSFSEWGMNVADFTFSGEKPENPCAEAVFRW